MLISYFDNDWDVTIKGSCMKNTEELCTTFATTCDTKYFKIKEQLKQKQTRWLSSQVSWHVVWDKN